MYITHTLCCTENHTCFFFFNDTATTEIYTLSLHDALPILPTSFHGAVPAPVIEGAVGLTKGLAGGLLAVDVLGSARSEEHTSELQSQSNLVCRLLLEKKKHQHVGRHDRPAHCAELLSVSPS